MSNARHRREAEMQSLPPANWYPDPSDNRRLRYWDGTKWLDSISQVNEQNHEDPLLLLKPHFAALQQFFIPPKIKKLKFSLFADYPVKTATAEIWQKEASDEITRSSYLSGQRISEYVRLKTDSAIKRMAEIDSNLSESEQAQAVKNLHYEIDILSWVSTVGHAILSFECSMFHLDTIDEQDRKLGHRSNFVEMEKAKDMDRLSKELENFRKAMRMRLSQDTVLFNDGDESTFEFPGVYVYTYPQYSPIDYGYEFLAKIGMSEVGVYGRVYSQGRKTEVPEDPILLRCYESYSARDLETYFHRELKESKAGSRSGGTEWFRTSLAEIDMLFSNCPIEVVREYRSKEYE